MPLFEMSGENLVPVPLRQNSCRLDSEPPRESWRLFGLDWARGSGISSCLTLFLQFTDGLKRVIQTKKDAEVYQGGQTSEGRIVSGRVVFDAFGRTVAQYYPVFESGSAGQLTFNQSFDAESPTLTEYDSRDRVTRLTLPDATTVSHDYRIEDDAFHTVTTDQEGNDCSVYRDIRDLITRVVEHDGKASITTRYGYDPLKQIRTVLDAAGHKTEVDYDLLGRRRAIDNPDTGRVEMVYDKAGNLRARITPKRASGHPPWAYGHPPQACRRNLPGKTEAPSISRTGIMPTPRKPSSRSTPPTITASAIPARRCPRAYRSAWRTTWIRWTEPVPLQGTGGSRL